MERTAVRLPTQLHTVWSVVEPVYSTGSTTGALEVSAEAKVRTSCESVVPMSLPSLFGGTARIARPRNRHGGTQQQDSTPTVSRIRQPRKTRSRVPQRQHKGFHAGGTATPPELQRSGNSGNGSPI